MHRTIGIMDKG